MDECTNINEKEELRALCARVRELTHSGSYQTGKRIAALAMSKYPSAAAPHNLLGVLLEKEGRHTAAMKHFRAAWALDPTYLPARHNLDACGAFYAKGSCAFDESDCPPPRQRECVVTYDERHIGHIAKQA